LLVAVTIAAPTQGPSCTRDDSGTNVINFAGCAGLEETEDVGKLYCRIVNIDALNGYNGQPLPVGVKEDYRCVQCRTRCDCEANQYCQNNANIETDFGRCLEFPENFIGQECSSQATAAVLADINAFEFYGNLTRAFTCGVTDHCDCPEQTQACRDAIQAYACQMIFNPCNQVGLEEGPRYRTCRNVEYYCGRTFLCAGIPRLTCNHTFYTTGIERVDIVDIPLNNLDDPDADDGGSSRRAGIIALIVLLSLLALIVLGILGYILYQRSSALSSVVFDDESKLGEYEAM